MWREGELNDNNALHIWCFVCISPIILSNHHFCIQRHPHTMPFVHKTMTTTTMMTMGDDVAACAAALKFNSCCNFRAIFFNALNYIQQKEEFYLIKWIYMHMRVREYKEAAAPRTFVRHICSNNKLNECVCVPPNMYAVYWSLTRSTFCWLFLFHLECLHLIHFPVKGKLLATCQHKIMMQLLTYRFEVENINSARKQMRSHFS